MSPQQQHPTDLKPLAGSIGTPKDVQPPKNLPLPKYGLITFTLFICKSLNDAEVSSSFTVCL